MTPAGTRATVPRATITLTRVFLARLFENEITNGTSDLLQAFFWIVSLLSMPGACLPLLMSFNWIVYGHLYGVDALRVAAEPDKVFYLGGAMIGAAAVSALVWNSLLIDRRDALVLGMLPVRAPGVVLAKLCALGMYVGLIALAMAGLSSISWGMFLSDGRGGSFAFAARGIVGHFVGTSAAVAATLFSVTAAQGLVLAACGPRIFARLSNWLQLFLVATIGAAMVALPSITTTVAANLEINGAGRLVWQLETPPVWFLGLYETAFGTSRHDFHALADTALLSLALAAVVTILCQTLAYRRVMRHAVEHNAGAVGRSTRLASVVAHLLASQPPTRAVIDFFVTTISRVERQRLVLAVAMGSLLAWTLPTLLRWNTLRAHPPAQPAIDLLTLPLSLMVFVVVGLRVAAAVPSDLRASWIFDIERPPALDLRGVMERLLIVFGVLPFVAGFFIVHWYLWGPGVAVRHALFALVIGALLVELLLIGYRGVPCTRAWRPDRAQLRAWWPVYGLGFLWLASGLPLAPGPLGHPETLMMRSVAPNVVFDGMFLVAALALRAAARRSTTSDPDGADRADAIGILDLN